MITTIRVRPLRVDPLTENDIKRGITDAASAVFEINKQTYHITKTGGRICFSTPITQEDLKNSKVKLYMYDRQHHMCNGACYFSVDPFMNFVVNKGEVDIFFLQSWPIVFRLVNVSEFRRDITKNYTPSEFEELLPWWKGYVTHKDEYLKYVS